MTESALVQFSAHSKSRELKPAQQVKLLLGYLVVRLLFPAISLAQYLTASDNLLGATDENRLFPKDALDHWMPTKGSKHTPEERVKFMATYIDYATATGASAISFDAFMAAVLGAAPAETPTAPAAAATPPSPPPLPPAAATPAPVQPVQPVQPPPAAAPVDPTIPQVQVGISPAERAKAVEYLNLGSAVGGVAVGDPLLNWVVDCCGGKLHVDVVNGEPRPSVDIYFERGGEVIADMPVDTLCTDILNNYVLRGKDATIAVEIKLQ